MEKNQQKLDFSTIPELNAPIIFIGPGRSGSTIISEFILSHEQLAWPSQYQEWFPQWPSLARLRCLTDNRYWSITAEKAQLNNTRRFNSLIPRPAEAYPYWEWLTDYKRDFSRSFMLKDKASKMERDHIREKIGSLVKQQKRQRFAMKLTGPGRIGYLKSVFPDAVFINVVRSPHATISSMLNVPFWQNQGMHQLWWQGAYNEDELSQFQVHKGDSYWGGAFQLAKVMQTTQDEAKAEKAAMLTVNYEDFIAKPELVIQQILAFCDLPASNCIAGKLERSPIQNRNTQSVAIEKDQWRVLNSLFPSDQLLRGY